MGYDVGASVFQGWKLNDFFESYAVDEMKSIREAFNEVGGNDDGVILFGRDLNEGVEVYRPSWDDDDFYVGMFTEGGSVANRGGSSESTFVLRNPGFVADTARRVFRTAKHPLFDMVADMMKTKEVKNYLLLSESY